MHCQLLIDLSYLTTLSNCFIQIILMVVKMSSLQSTNWIPHYILQFVLQIENH